MTRFHPSIHSLALALALMLPPIAAQAEAEPNQPLALRGIMQDLGRLMQTVTLAISREDWTLVEKSAPMIADHPTPPLMEKARILAFAGSNVGMFKQHDAKTHEAARALGQAARIQDGQAVISAFQTLQMNCYGCHREFRKPFVEHFYGAR